MSSCLSVCKAVARQPHAQNSHTITRHADGKSVSFAPIHSERARTINSCKM